MNKGDTVLDDYGCLGVIKEVYQNFEAIKNSKPCPILDPEGWIEIQQKPVLKSDLNGRWYSVLILQGGSILIPERRLELVSSSSN